MDHSEPIKRPVVDSSQGDLTIERRLSSARSISESQFSTWVDTHTLVDVDGRQDDLGHEVLVDELDDFSIDELVEVFECLEFLEEVWPSDSEEVFQEPIQGKYHMIRQIGRGGMGDVWAAEQRSPIQRALAIKVIRAGLISDAAVARFNAERQMVAKMVHPGIANLIDAGECEDGRLFFAMELVEGDSLTAYCDDRRMSIESRLRLFIEICSAVEHAHQKAIIHRDLKPSNILVGEIDGRPQPKVIDFGLAKLQDSIDADISEGKVDGKEASEEAVDDAPFDFGETLHGQLVGTVQYMSPEQARRSNQEVDTRTDVFSLGVILYELLTGSTPITHAGGRDDLKQTLARIIAEPPPSLVDRVRSDSKIEWVAARRNTSVPRLQNDLRQDLNWIAKKALAKDPNQRYTTVAELRSDLQHFLAHEPVSAVPSTAGYRLRKFFRKNRPMVAAALVLAATLLIGIIGTAWGWQRALQAQKRAEISLEQTKKSNQILTEIFDDIDVSSVEQSTEPIKMIFARRLLKAAADLDAESVGNEVEVAEMQLKLSHSLNALGFPDESLPFCKSAFNTLNRHQGMSAAARKAARELALVFRYSGDLSSSGTILEEQLEFCRDELGDQDWETLETINELAKNKLAQFGYREGQKLFEEAMLGRQELFSEDSLATMDSTFGLAKVYVGLWQEKQAFPMLDQVLKYRRENLPEGHPDIIRVLSILAWGHVRGRNFSEAERFSNEAYELAKLTFGENHRAAYQALVYVGLVEYGKRDHLRAKATLEKAVDGLENSSGFDHHDTAVAKKVLMALCKSSLDYVSAISLADSEVNPKSALSVNSIHAATELAELYLIVDEFTKARKVLEDLNVRAMDVEKTIEVKTALMNAKRILARVYFEENDFEGSVSLLKKVLPEFESELSRYHFSTMLCIADLGKSLSADEDFDEAIDLLKDYLDELKAQTNSDPLMQTIITAQLGVVLSQAGELNDGIELMEKIVNGPRRLKEMEYLVHELRSAYLKAGKTELLTGSFQKQLGFLRRRTGPSSLTKARYLAEIGLEAIQFNDWQCANDVIMESASILESIHEESAQLAESWEYWFAKFEIGLTDLALLIEENPEQLNMAQELEVGVVLAELEKSFVKLNRLQESQFAFAKRDLIKTTERINELLKSNLFLPTEIEVWREHLLELRL